MNRNEHTGLKNLAAVVLIVLLLAGGYYFYRILKNPSASEFAHLTSLWQFPPSVCTYTSSDFGISAKGALYISKGRLRIDTYIIQANETELVHTVVITDRSNYSTAYQWIDGATTGITKSAPYVSNEDPVMGTVVCKPWWFPTDAPFKIPDGVTFSSGQ